MTFEIQSGVAKPAIRRSRGGKPSTYPFAQMQVGQTFIVRFESDSAEEREKIARRVRAAVLAYRAKNELSNFSTLTVAEEDGEGVRVWRDPDLTSDQLAVRKAKQAARAQATA